jgi:hypothetical protein
MKMSQKLPEPRRVLIAVSEDEADALMSVLLNCAPSSEVPEGVAENLLCRVARAQRGFSRLRARAGKRARASATSAGESARVA